MAEPIRNDFLTERDKQVFAASGYGVRGSFGKRPALLVIDVNYAFCGDKPEPILESIKRWRNSCGEESWQAVAAIKTLVDKAHTTGLPVIYTTGVRRDAPMRSRSSTACPRACSICRKGNSTTRSPCS